MSAHQKNQANESAKFEKLLDKKENIQLLYETVNRLSFVNKSIISLVLEDVSTKEIADVLGISEENVRVKIHRIKKILSQMMNGDRK
jgi:RNA polymerase sigma-70 factor (ECF subfamily)